MKYHKFLIIMATVAILLTAGLACADPILEPADSGEVQSAVETFAFRVAAELEGQGKDFFFSPYSILTALVMTREGAAGETREEMDKILSLSDRSAEQLVAWSKALEEHMNGSKTNPVFEEANRIWLAEDFSPRKEYQDTLLL